MISPSDLRPSGGYTEYHGATYRTSSVHSPGLRLWLPEGAVPGPEFKVDSRGRWSAYVPRTDADRIYRLETRARWQGHDVEIVELRDGRVRLEAWTYPPPPGTSTPENTYWQVWASLSDVTDVTETVREIAP